MQNELKDNINSTDKEIKQEPVSKLVIKQIFGIGLAAIFLYFSFRNANFKELARYAQNLDILFLAILFCTGLLSHLVRAWRWLILLAPLQNNSGKKISLWNSFCAVMYGYAVNVVLPRGGEIARLVSISKSESIPWMGVLPTMFIDRLLDIAMLVLLIGITLVLMPSDNIQLPWLLPAGLAMCLATFAGLVILPFVGKIGSKILSLDILRNKIPENIDLKLKELLNQFDLGSASLKNFSNLSVIALSSLLIWFLYWLNLYLMIFAFHLDKKVNAVQSLIVFTIGSVGVLVPTPGSVGSYHFLISQGLQKIAFLNPDQSLSFATVLHIFCFVIMTCLPAAICFLIQQSMRKSIN